MAHYTLKVCKRVKIKLHKNGDNIDNSNRYYIVLIKIDGFFACIHNLRTKSRTHSPH